MEKKGEERVQKGGLSFLDTEFNDTGHPKHLASV